MHEEHVTGIHIEASNYFLLILQIGYNWLIYTIDRLRSETYNVNDAIALRMKLIIVEYICFVIIKIALWRCRYFQATRRRDGLWNRYTMYINVFYQF